jgi:hypothetical protein
MSWERAAARECIWLFPAKFRVKADGRKHFLSWSNVSGKIWLNKTLPETL